MKRPEVSKNTDDAAGEGVPSDFREVFGFETTLKRWTSLVLKGNLPPVLLLEGRAGLGKAHLAAALAALHVCENIHASNKHIGACGVCEGCIWFLAGEHPEIWWLRRHQGAAAGSPPSYNVEDATSLQEHLSLKPGHGARRRVAVIVDVDQLTVQAANRLLKTLEEPPEDGLIIMTTSRRRHLLPTVLSRCVRWPVAPPAAQSTLKVLKAAYEAAGYTHGNLEYFEDLLRRAALSPKLALAFMEEDAQASTNPLKEALALVAAGHAASGKTDESLTALLKAAEALARPKEFSAARLLQSLEVELNHWYRQQLSNGVTAASTPYQRSVRRQILRDTKRLASRGRVALNKQLIAEAVALSQR